MRGIEWVVEAHGCDPSRLSDLETLHSLFGTLIRGLELHPVADTLWHKFGKPGGGVTGLCLLAESHIACHTFPEHGSLCLNVFCCRERKEWDFDACLRRNFAAHSVQVRRIERPYCS
jgi:S-adenosylmethionine decarboxylase